MTFRLASYRSFCKVWLKYTPRIMITTPKSDLSWTCQKNSMTITMSANKSEFEKLEVIEIIVTSTCILRYLFHVR